MSNGEKSLRWKNVKSFPRKKVDRKMEECFFPSIPLRIRCEKLEKGYFFLCSKGEKNYTHRSTQLRRRTQDFED